MFGVSQHSLPADRRNHVEPEQDRVDLADQAGVGKEQTDALLRNDAVAGEHRSNERLLNGLWHTKEPLRHLLFMTLRPAIEEHPQEADQHPGVHVDAHPVPGLVCPLLNRSIESKHRLRQSGDLTGQVRLVLAQREVDAVVGHTTFGDEKSEPSAELLIQGYPPLHPAGFLHPYSPVTANIRHRRVDTAVLLQSPAIQIIQQVEFCKWDGLSDAVNLHVVAFGELIRADPSSAP